MCKSLIKWRICREKSGWVEWNEGLLGKINEEGYSAVVVLKSEYWYTLNADKEMRVAVTTLLSNFETLTHGKQTHGSH